MKGNNSNQKLKMISIYSSSSRFKNLSHSYNRHKKQLQIYGQKPKASEKKDRFGKIKYCHAHEHKKNCVTFYFSL